MSESNHWMFENKTDFSVLKELNTDWQVNFDPEWGGPPALTFNELQDWSKNADPKIKFYSGKAIYRKKFDLSSALAKTKQIFLDLGVVNDIASVKLNGKDFGILWTTPWMLEVSKYLKPTDNLLEIEVINQWPNRLIGDVGLPKEKRVTNTNIVFKKDSPLLPSGLLGPVTLKL
ncbi:MAG: hypothetical protein EOO07_06700 [Chitinophagaceae bacterium]|nr:MAG: hypothetical protein EOO07_06700 [Chitinophagaceae bacterium]